MKRSVHKFSKTAVSETVIKYVCAKKTQVVYRNRGKKQTRIPQTCSYKQRKIVLKQNINLYKYIIKPRIKMAGFRLQIRLRNRLQIMYTM